MSKYLMMLVMFLTLSTHTQAALVTLQSIKIDNTFENLNGFKSYWQNNILNASQAVSYENDNFENIKTGGYNLNLLSINFELAGTSMFSFFAGLDAHYGAEIYIDNTLVYTNDDDLWWSKNWNNKDVVELENLSLSAGQKAIDLFWAESCCNGPNSIMFSFDDAAPLYLSNASLKSAIPSVAAPTGLSLIIIGVFCLLLVKIQRKAKK